VKRVHVIDDVDTLKLIAEPTRAALIELLTEPRTVTQLAQALDVPRTRLYHHIELLQARGLVEQVDERAVRALTERVYALAAKVIRPSARLLRSKDTGERLAALLTLLFDTTKADLHRAVSAGELQLDPKAAESTGQLGLGRSIAYLAPERAAEFVRELDALVERFDAAHEPSTGRPFAFVWAFYPSSRKIQ
jgi:DNA-binding transcriptional ArsR family regulator